MSSDNLTVNRSYRDNFDIKEFTESNLVAKYFPDIEPSLRTVGMIAFTTEQISNISEDVFNSGTVLFRETFPNRAQIPESIYSHAAIFQLQNVFSSAASCDFLLVMEEEAIIKNMVDDYRNGIYYFYIDKNTIIYVEDIPFTIDYDIEMKIVKRTSEKYRDEYLFSASYMIPENFKNTMSDLKDPYIKVRRSDDGYVALEIHCHQCLRSVEYYNVLTSNNINYKTIDIEFEGKIAGFDIMYRDPSSTTFDTQLQKLVVYSQPVGVPFCYYQMFDENTIRISFNTKDDFFSPKYGSELEVTLYTTLGEDGNFDIYNGTDISIVPTDEKYQYANSYITATKPFTASVGGGDQLSLDALQSLAVMGYRTATALTTEYDLAEYFNNYKYLYHNSDVLFIKKRNDIYERLYAAFLIMRNNDFIFKTNTLNLFLNLSEMEEPEQDIYMLEPGYLFTANDTSGFAQFLRDPEYNLQFWNEYQEALTNGTIPYIPGEYDKEDIPAYLDRPASFAEFKRRKGYDDKLQIFEFENYDDLRKYDSPSDSKFLYINPFLIRFKKRPNLVSLYMTYIDQKALVDFTWQNTESYVQFILYEVQLQREFSMEKKYHFMTKLLPSVTVSENYPVIQQREVLTTDEDGDEITEKEYVLNEPYSVFQNDLRVFLVIKDEARDICCIELIPTDYDDTTQNFTFSAEFNTDDHITSDGKVRLLKDELYLDLENGGYYIEDENNEGYYIRYDSQGDIIEPSVLAATVYQREENGLAQRYRKVHTMDENIEDILIPMTDVTCRIYTLYRRKYSPEEGGLVPYSIEETMHPLMNIEDLHLEGYVVTNEYQTASDPLTFLKPLNNVRSNLVFKDYTLAENISEDEENPEYKYTYDIMDVDMYSLPFVKWNLNETPENLSFFMNSFLAQYNALTKIIHEQLRNETSIDVKFYNTYGRSRDFRIGEEEELLSTVNLTLSFDMWFIPGTDTLNVKDEVKRFIKTEVETINSSGMNNLYISNLMRKIETQFAYVDHIRFRGINHYHTGYQAIKNYVEDLNDLTVEERRYYVPELLVIDLEDITINDYVVD